MRMKGFFSLAALSLWTSYAQSLRADEKSVVIKSDIQIAKVWLTDHRGEAVAFEALLKSPVPKIISFTYTGCRSLCPISDAIMNSVELEVEKGRHNIALITLTIDPLNDSPSALARKALEQQSGERRFWLGGDPADVYSALEGLGIQFGELEFHALEFIVIGPSAEWIARVDGSTAAPDLIRLAKSQK